MQENLRALVPEASRVCRERNVAGVDNLLVAYMACLLEVGGSAGGGSGTEQLGLLQPMSAAQVAHASSRIVHELSQRSSPVLAAVKLQVTMDQAFEEQQQLVEQRQAEHMENAGMLARAITMARPPRENTMAAHERMLGRVLEYVCVAAGLEAALTDTLAKEEVRLAMESVFPLSALARFYTLPKEERTQQIEELARITLGICLFNRDMGRGGSALGAGTANVVPQASRMARDISRHVGELQAEVRGCCALMRLRGEGGSPEVQAEGARAQAEGIAAAQALVLFENLGEDLQAGLDTVETLEQEVAHLLLQAQDAVGGASAVPKSAVFPLFSRLGALQQAVVGEARLLVVRQRLFERLEAARSQPMGVTLLQLAAKARRPGRKTDAEVEVDAMLAEARAVEKGKPPSELAEGVEFVPPGAAASSPGPPVSQRALNGFDAVALAKQAQLRQGDPQLGCLRLRRGGEGEGEAAESSTSKLYCFATWDAMNTFAANPMAVDAATRAAVARQPVLARLLGLGAEYEALDVQAVLAVVSGNLKVDFGCQTPVHFVERHKDYRYEWNEWALRRRALQLTNLRHKATHSAQTGLSHFKRDADSQVWEPRAAQVQTRVSKGQSMPKKLQYVTGLRGAPDTAMHVVRLDLELGQSHQH